MKASAPAEILKRAQLCRFPAIQRWQNTDRVPALTHEGADVWLCPLSPDSALSSLLSREETERAQNFFPESKAVEFKLARAWLRSLLACYVAETEPQSIRLGIADGGKPYLLDYPQLRFNLSHSGEFVAIAVSRHQVGVDIEKLRPLPDWRELAEGLLTEYCHRTNRQFARGRAQCGIFAAIYRARGIPQGDGRRFFTEHDRV